MARLQLTTQALALTAEEAFPRLAERPYSVFLDSAVATTEIGRYSVLAINPLALVSSEAEWQRELDTWGTQEVRIIGEASDTEPWPFYGGWIGYVAYEYYSYLIPQVPARPTRYPLMGLGFYDSFLFFDHMTKQAFAASLGLPQLGAASDLQLAKRRIAALMAALEAGGLTTSAPSTSRPLHAMTKREQYTKDLMRIKEYIRAGDCYQVNYTQRFDGETSQAAPELYIRLRRLSPAPMAAYLDRGTFQILSASPESFLTIGDGYVQTRPIKGTRPRGDTPLADTQLKKALLDSEKDRAELLMITDLERNDLGRVCVPGTVETKQLVGLQSLEQVHHLYSLVAGRLPAEVTPWEVLTHCFPGGSITGAPKIRAMQIIRDLEPHSREVYTGALGFLSVDGQSHWNIPIRTLLYEAGHVTTYAGGGIVADSDPEAEYEECLVKLSGIRAALNRPQVKPI